MMIEKKKNEREREQQMIPIATMSRAIEESRVAMTKKMRRLELSYYFLGKIKFNIIFVQWVEQDLNMND